MRLGHHSEIHEQKEAESLVSRSRVRCRSWKLRYRVAEESAYNLHVILGKANCIEEISAALSSRDAAGLFKGFFMSQ